MYLRKTEIERHLVNSILEPTEMHTLAGFQDIKLSEMENCKNMLVLS